MKATLNIHAAIRKEITCLEQSYFTAPFKLANITEDKHAKRLHLVLMSSSPGILDGDEYEIKIGLGEGADMELHTQSYQRLFNMRTGATQQVEVCLQKGASFIYLPHPVVPHQHSIFTNKNRICLNDDCRLVWGEILTCGRKINEEVFQCSVCHTITEIFIHGKLVIKENLLMRPSSISPSVIGQLEEFTHQASFIYLDEKAGDTGISNMIHEYLSVQKEIVFGITAAPVNGWLVRLLGYKAEQLHHCLKAINEIIATAINKKEVAVNDAN